MIVDEPATVRIAIIILLLLLVVELMSINGI